MDVAAASALFTAGAAGLDRHRGHTVRLQDKHQYYNTSVMGGCWGWRVCGDLGGVDGGAWEGAVRHCKCGGGRAVAVQDLQVSLVLHLPLKGRVPVVLDGVICPENE